ncbi:MAG: hypothetical protein HQ539_02005 [Parcubacteria group bacterium]|nr:hypothetical protein [Parcubacteria group bacterium]
MLWNILNKIKKIFLPCEANDCKPKILDSNFLVYFLVCLIVLKIVSFGVLLEFSESDLFAEVSRNILIQMLNKDRGELGIGELVENPALNKAAGLKAQHMLEQGYFDHNSPEGITPWFWFKVAGYDYYYAGENLGIGFLDSEEIHQAWQDSPLHQANLLNPDYREIGIAIVRGDFKGTKNTVVVQLFGSMAEQTPVVPIVMQPIITERSEELRSVESSNIVAPIEPTTTEPEVAPAESKPVGESELKDTTKDSLKFKFYTFMAMNYHNILEWLIFSSLAVIAMLLLISIFVRIEIQHRRLTLKIFILLILLAVCVYLNRDIVLRIIPHTVSIY